MKYIVQQDPAVDQEVVDLFDGDVKKFVNETLVGKQHYLRRERVQVSWGNIWKSNHNHYLRCVIIIEGPDPEVEIYEYSWGERAELEVSQSHYGQLPQLSVHNGLFVIILLCQGAEVSRAEDGLWVVRV